MAADYTPETKHEWLERIDAGYSLIVRLMFYAASLYVGMMMVVIVYYTSFRSMGWDYNDYSFTFIEYGFIYVLMLGCPWMVRQRAHVYIELVTAAVPDQVRVVLSRAIAAACFLVCLTLAVYTGMQTWQDYSWGQYDELRGQLDIKRWIVIVAMPIGFGFTALEFIRFVFGSSLIHTGEMGVHE
ncbi:TRAP transporter small permease [Hwanghaeella sp.]|uniref:TRAP transporter small permease n=1 Tax=Hwanghaeella sp. TaxID=2605943 RepID=UPI003CCC3EA7